MDVSDRVFIITGGRHRGHDGAAGSQWGRAGLQRVASVRAQRYGYNTFRVAKPRLQWATRSLVAASTTHSIYRHTSDERTPPCHAQEDR